MALVGKLTKYDRVETGEIITQTITYPSDLPQDHPDFDKAGTVEEFQVPEQEVVSTTYENAYAIIHSINSWKHLFEDGTKTLFNITYRIYESKDNRISDYDSYIIEDYIVSQELNYSIKENEIQQAYELLKQVAGCEELIND